MARDEIRRRWDELPSVAKLRDLIGTMRVEDLTLLAGKNDTKLHQLRERIANVTASKEAKLRLQSKFDAHMSNVLYGTVTRFPSADELRARGSDSIVVKNTKTTAISVLEGIQHLPYFDEEKRLALSAAIRRVLVEKHLIGPSVIE